MKISEAPKTIRDYYSRNNQEVISGRELMTDKNYFVIVKLANGKTDSWRFQGNAGQRCWVKK